MNRAQDKFVHRHLYFFHKMWDLDHDGSLTAADFETLAETFAVLQRNGKWEEDVVLRWKQYLRGWFDIILSETSKGNDAKASISVDDWFLFLRKIGILCDSYAELPDFLKAYSNLLFVLMDCNKDGLICVKDYRMYLAKQNLDIMRANDCYAFMLTSTDIRNDSILTRERFDELFYEFWTSRDPAVKGQYIMGPYDSIPLAELDVLTRRSKAPLNK